jgi:hypothetical protein
MKEQAEEFILGWLEYNHSINILDSNFIDTFSDVTGARIEPILFGPNKCKYASTTLSKMYKEKILTRRVVGLGSNWQPGFPKWVYSYRLADSNE